MPKEVQKLVSKSEPKRGASVAQGAITSGTALLISRRIKDPERQLALAKAIGQEGVSQTTARSMVKEAAAYPGESIPKIIRRVVETAPELHLSPEDAEIVRMGGQSQVTLTKKDERIKEGAKIDLYTKFAEVKVVSVTKKALRDFTEEDAKA